MTDKTQDAVILARALKLEEYQVRFFKIIARLMTDKESRLLFLQIARLDNAHRARTEEVIGEMRTPTLEKFSASEYAGIDLRSTMKEGAVAAYKCAIKLKGNCVNYYSEAIAKADARPVKLLLFDLIEDEENLKKCIEQDLCRLLESRAKNFMSGVAAPRTCG